ncbi:MAG: hypothetical protein K9M99_05990 [Candidatus Cloacimonetes bacterium]|nr:hypothetical protein [Candidatus Cloacimonadota bacterium]
MMKIILVFLVLSLFCYSQAVTVETDSLRNFLYGAAPGCSYDNWVSHIAEGIARVNFNVYAPWEEQTEGFGAFRIPDELELQQWGAVYAAFISGELEAAEALIDSFSFPYEVVDFTDLESGRNFKMLRENIDEQYFDNNGTEAEYDDESGAFGYGWGLYIYNPAAAQPVIISTPHPNDDYITVAISLDCLLAWDAMFWFVSGAGREVEWTEVGIYNNGKSISDPTRNDEHPQIVACRQATDYIRENFRREFSAQIHSYDWNRHGDRANCQVSVVQSNPNLPTRDLSGLHYDLINQGDYLMIPANEYGNYYDCYINDYYAVNYSLYPFHFVYDDTMLVVNDEIDLPGVGGAFREFAIEDWNTYDVYDPFFHMEMDELPNEFLQNTYQLDTFYGFDYENDEWNAQTRYDKVRSWYSRWVTDLGIILPDVIALDDGQEPVAVDSMWFEELSESSVDIHWQPQPCYDFFSYRLYVDTAPIDPEVSPYYDRLTDLELASPLAEELNVGDLEINTLYYFQIASLDYNDNVSYSEQVEIYTSPAEIGELSGIGIDDYSQLFWEAEHQSGNQGFNVYRCTMPYSNWALHASWETEPSLVSTNINGQDFEYVDEQAGSNGWYRYKLSAENIYGTEYFFAEEVETISSQVYNLKFINGEIRDSIAFATNQYATDGLDEYFEILSGPYLGEDLYTRLYHPEWSQNWYKRDIKAFYSMSQTWKTWAIEVRSQFEEGDALQIELDAEFPDYTNIYLEDNYSGDLYNLNDEFTDEVILSGTGSASLQLHVGYVQPDIDFTNLPDTIYQAGDEVVTPLQLLFPQLVNTASVLLDNGEQQIMIIDNLTDIPEAIVWNAPEDITIHAAELRVYFESLTGIPQMSVSDYEIGIVPLEYTYDLAAGWHNIAGVWLEDEYEVEDVFGAGAELYEWTGSEYSQADMLQFGKGYWLDLPAESNFTGSGELSGSSFTMTLLPGWNLLANPHPAPLEIDGLIFHYFTWNYSFRQMVSAGSLSKLVYAYRDSLFMPVQEVEAGESFYLYNYRDSSFAINVEFIPYSNGIPLPTVVPDWQIGVMLSQSGDNSEVVLGAVGNSSDDFNVLYDFPALPAKPQDQGCQIYLSALGMSYPVPSFHTLFSEPFDDEGLREFDFIARGNPDNNLELSFQLAQISLEHYAWLEVDSEIYDLDQEQEFSFEPDESGQINGTVKVMYPRVWDYGNVDKDGGVEAYDGAIVLQYSVGIEPIAAPLPWAEWRLITANVDGNQTIDSYDAALILQYCISIIEVFPVESREYQIAPAGDVTICQSGNNLSFYSCGEVYSLDLELPPVVADAVIKGENLLWADNQQESYKLAIASAEGISTGKQIAELNLMRQIKTQEIHLKVNGRYLEPDLQSGEVPQVTELYPVSPNPVVVSRERSPELQVSFAVSGNQLVKIDVYNIRGQKVKNLTNQVYDQGLHNICWQMDNENGKPVSSGVYFLAMDTGIYRNQRKFIVLK